MRACTHTHNTSSTNYKKLKFLSQDVPPQSKKKTSGPQLFEMAPRFNENWSCPAVTIKSVKNATAFDPHLSRCTAMSFKSDCNFTTSHSVHLVIW